MKGWLFFPLMLAAMIAMAAFAMTQAPPRPGAPVEAVADADALVLDAVAVNQLAPTAGFPVTSAPGLDGNQTGPRTVADGALEAGSTGEGARLVLGPGLRAALKDGPVRISLDVGAIPYATAQQLAVAWVTAGAAPSWVVGDVPDEGGVVTLDLPAPAGAPLALALWPAVEGKGSGIELRGVRLERVDAVATPETLPVAAPVGAPEAASAPAASQEGQP